ncbi:hypothetical protein M9Y10_037872 [Tritrichomonas musculus]|uniref:Exostosin GT47 domain-containing protein n=1 Tax=Tritrichomonas musculus TaxID=1915356 RepID=A0ABR2K707_9EUKA
MNKWLISIHILHISLLYLIMFILRYRVAKTNNVSVIPFTQNYYQFMNSFPPTKIYVYNETHPDFQPFYDTIFDESTDKRFNTHSYVPDLFIFQNIFSQNFIVSDPFQADVFFLRFLCSQYKWGFHIYDLYPIIEKQGPFYQRYGGVDHFFLHTTHSISYSVIVDEDHMKIPNMFTTQMLHWNETLMYPRIMIRITSSPVYSNYPLSKLKRKKEIAVLLLAGIDVHVPEISIFRKKLFQSFSNISGCRSVVTYRYLGVQMEYKPRYHLFMEKSQICIIPAGDCYNSKRFFDSLKKLCVPFVFSDHFRFPFESLFVNYESIIVQQPMFEYHKIRHNIMLLNSQKIKQMRYSLHSIGKIYDGKVNVTAQPGQYVWSWFWTQFFQLCYIAATKRRNLLEMDTSY